MKYILLFLFSTFINTVSSITCYITEIERVDCDTYTSDPDDPDLHSEDDTVNIILIIMGMCFTILIGVFKYYCNKSLNGINDSSSLSSSSSSHSSNTLYDNNQQQNCYLPSSEETTSNITISSNVIQNGNSSDHLPSYEEALEECDITIVCYNDFSNSNTNTNTNTINHSISVV